jgi:hypothetical protein
MPRDVSDAEVLNALMDKVRDELRFCGVGIVTGTSNWTSSGVIDVQPAVENPLFDEDGNRTNERLPVLPSIPLMATKAGSYFIVIEPNVGDSVFLYAADLSHDTWRASTAGTPQTVTPGMASKHTADSYFAVLGGYPDANWPSTPGTARGQGAIVLGSDGGPVVRIDGSKISLTQSYPAPDYAALASKVDTALAAIAAAFNSHTHLYFPALAPAPVPTPTGSPTASTPPEELPVTYDVGSTVVAIE